ncbi:diaminopimelate epimerase, partial [Candidatus Bathyarchaeota archaeon]
MKVDMGKPEFDRKKIPMAGDGLFIDQELKVDGKTFRATALSVGNPHCVIFVDNVKDFPVSEVGPKIENHELFPNRVNVEFVEVISRKELWLRVWERGVGETLACGTGACASVVAAKTLNKV